jgi:hypothetical protein
VHLLYYYGRTVLYLCLQLTICNSVRLPTWRDRAFTTVHSRSTHSRKCESAAWYCTLHLVLFYISALSFSPTTLIFACDWWRLPASSTFSNSSRSFSFSFSVVVCPCS